MKPIYETNNIVKIFYFFLFFLICFFQIYYFYIYFTVLKMVLYICRKIIFFCHHNFMKKCRCVWLKNVGVPD